MKKRNFNLNLSPTQSLTLGWILILLLAYGRLLLHPELHTGCLENDIWNLPIRWSVLSSLRQGSLPLWNPLLAFGFPWLATWTTETFYPGTLLFTWGGLAAWNYSGVLHLFIFSLGIYHLLKKMGAGNLAAFFSAAVALMNGCAYNHLGSNSPTDTMAWIPWIFVAVHDLTQRQKHGAFRLALFLTLQIFAGYAQVILYTLMGAGIYGLFLKGWKFLPRLFTPILAALFLTTCQWLPSVEYYSHNAVRFPAVHDNPDFLLPLANLKTFFNFNALWNGSIPDYIASPTFFYFNFYSGLIPLVILLWGLFRWPKLKSNHRFFLAGFVLLTFWAFGFFAKLVHFVPLPLMALFEPAKSTVLVNLFELVAIGLLFETLLAKSNRLKWAVLALAIADLLFAVWAHPVETNLLPGNPFLQAEAEKIKEHLGTGRLLVLSNEKERQEVYFPRPSLDHTPLFKHFIANSNMYAFLPATGFCGSTWPSKGAFDAQLYFQYGFPYAQGSLMDLLGVDLLLVTAESMPSRYKKINQDGAWTLWKNPNSVGDHFLFLGEPQTASRKDLFQAFAEGKTKPLQNLYLDPLPLSAAPQHPLSPLYSKENSLDLPGGEKGYLIVTKNGSPGWRAWVDGKPTGIFLADGIFQGVPFPANAKKVVLQYEPASFRLGLFISLMASAFFLGGIGLKRS
jgi:hypothetical protein